MFYINNPIKHYDDVTAFKLGLETMIKQIKENIKNDIPFISCFNTVALLKHVYDRVFDDSKVVYGLDYNLQKSDVYVFIDDRYRTINPVQVVQQLTRQRQIKDLYYCIDTAKSGPISFSILMRIEKT